VKSRQIEVKTPEQKENAPNRKNRSVTPPQEALPPTKFGTLFRPRRMYGDRQPLSSKTPKEKSINEEFNMYTTPAARGQEQVVFSNDTPLTGSGVGEYDLNSSAWAMMGDSEDFVWQTSGTIDEDGIAMMNESLISSNTSRDGIALSPDTDTAVAVDREKSTDSDSSPPSHLSQNSEQKGPANRLVRSSRAKKKDALSIIIPGKVSPFDAFRQNSTHIALDETSAYAAKIKELEAALESEKALRMALEANNPTSRFETPASFRSRMTASPSSLSSNSLDAGSLYARNQTLVKEVRFAEQTCIEVSEKNTNLEQQMTEHQIKLERLQTENQSLQKQLAHLDEQRTAAVSLENSWKARVSELESLLASAEEERMGALNKCREWENRYNKSIENTQRQIESNSDREGRLLRAILHQESLSKELGNTPQKLQSTEQELNEALRVEQELNSKLQLSENLNQQLQEEKKELENRLTQELCDLRNRFQAQLDESNAMNDELCMKLNDWKSLKDERDRLESQLHSIKEDILRQADTIQELRSTLSDTTKELTGEKNIRFEVMKKLSSEKEKLSNDLIEAQTENVTLRQQLEEMREQNALEKRKIDEEKEIIDESNLRAKEHELRQENNIPVTQTHENQDTCFFLSDWRHALATLTVEALKKCPQELNNFFDRIDEKSVRDAESIMTYRMECLVRLFTDLHRAMKLDSVRKETEIASTSNDFVDVYSASLANGLPPHQSFIALATNLGEGLSPARTVNLELMEEARQESFDETNQPLEQVVVKGEASEANMSESFSTIAGISHLFNEDGSDVVSGSPSSHKSGTSVTNSEDCEEKEFTHLNLEVSGEDADFWKMKCNERDAEVKELKTKLESVTAEAERASDELDRLKLDLSTLNTENGRLRAKVEEFSMSVNENENLRRDLDRASMEKDKAKEEYDRLSSEIALIKAANVELDLAKQKLESTLRERDQTAATVEAALEDACQRLEEAQAEILSLNSRLLERDEVETTLRDKMNMDANVISDLSASITEKDHQIEHLEKERMILVDRLDEKEKALEQVEEKMTSLLHTNDILQAEKSRLVKEIENEVRQQKFFSQDLDDEKAQLLESFESSECRRLAAEERAEDFEKRLFQVQGEYQALKSEYEEKAKEAVSQKQELSAAFEQIKTFRKTLQSDRFHLDKARQDLTRLDSVISGLEAEKAVLKSELSNAEKIKSEHEFTKAKSYALERKLKITEETLETITNELNTSKADNMAKLELDETLQRELSLARKAALDSEKRLLLAREAIVALESQMDRRRTLNKELQNKLDRSISDNANLTHELTMINSRLVQSEEMLKAQTSIELRLREELFAINEKKEAVEVEHEKLGKEIKQVRQSLSSSEEVRRGLEQRLVELDGALQDKEESLSRSNKKIEVLEKKCKGLRKYTRKVAGKCDAWEIYFEKIGLTPEIFSQGH
jgi:chromosome segregation ATPase